MDFALKEKVEKWFEAHREEIVRQVMRLVAIPSIARYDEPGFAYGKACHQAMDAYEQMAQSLGFKTERFDDHVASATFGCDPSRKTIGFWSHLDVVPPGNGWVFSPFEPAYEQGYIIGRGADDNKSSVVGVLNALLCLKELGVPLKSNLKAFSGCDEECGSLGVIHYAKHYPCPDFSIVPDCGFPVCYGEKGIINVTFRATRPLSPAFMALEGGVASNVIPDRARAVLARDDRISGKLHLLPDDIAVEVQPDRIALTASGTSGHAGFPVGAKNAVHELICALLDAQLAAPEDLHVLRFLHGVNRDCFGTALNIAMEDGESGRLTCAGTVLRLEDGIASLTANIRYCITASGDKIHAALDEAARKSGFVLAQFSDSAPNHFPKNHPVVGALTSVYNQIMGEDKQPYTMSGGTYARKLPNALGFGIGSMQHERCPLIPQGHGGAHLPDETLHVDSYLRALVILTMGIIAADCCLNGSPAIPTI